MMMTLTRLLLLTAGLKVAAAFLSQEPRCTPWKVSSTAPLSMAAMSYDEMLVLVDHYEVSVPKPLGVVFGENPDPFLGLVVDDVSEGMNGGRAGLRVGDQLLAVNEQVVVGKDFDSVMDQLQNQPKNLDLVMYRGPVSQLFTILSNQLGDDQSIVEDDDEESEPVIMDENYESPVVVEVKEEKPLTAGDFVKAMGKLGSMLGETLTSSPDEGAAAQPKKNNGFFGIGAETVQLEGDDAQGYKKEKIQPEDF